MPLLLPPLALALAVVLPPAPRAAAEPPAGSGPRAALAAALHAARARLLRESAGPAEREAAWEALDRDFPVAADWMRQDLPAGRAAWLGLDGDRSLDAALLAAPLAELGDTAPTALRQAADRLRAEHPPRGDPRWLETYLALGTARRDQRLRLARAKAPRIIFARHANLGGSHYAYTEGQSDAQNERHFHPGSALCLLEIDGPEPRVTTLMEDPHGVIRDPAVSWDGRRVAFAWKKSDRLDDYHLYEMDVGTRAVRQITFGLGFADYEPAYRPGGGLVFTSTRPVQTVDCWWTEVSNLYAVGADGRGLRRLTFDQVHDNSPQVLDDGRVVYTRWEYNDRGQIFVQSLFAMNSDGTAQQEFYGNSSWFPTSLLHARGLPGSGRVVAVASGHHSGQSGQLVLVDPARGRQENEGVRLIAPVRDTPAVRVDAYGQAGPQAMYPYPLSGREFLVTFCPAGRKEPHDRLAGRFAIFWMELDGRRELLASDPGVSCCQAVPLAARAEPPPRASTVDDRKATASCYVQDVGRGPGMRGVPPGTARALRVIALEYRAVGIGHNYSKGEAGAALSSTPPAVGNGAWDVKRVLGTVPLDASGSAHFTVPARTPLYVQALDADGHAIQTMRSWMTLQPGEVQSCAGCHESKNSAPPPRSNVPPPEPYAGLDPHAPGLSYPRRVQPVLDRHCVRCHDGGPAAAQPDLRGEPVADALARRTWSKSYLSLTHAFRTRDWEGNPWTGRANHPLVNWVSAQSAPPVQPPYAAGAARSGLIRLLRQGHRGVSLSRDELGVLACWIDLAVPYCGDYEEAGDWDDAARARHAGFLAKRRAMERIEAAHLRQRLGDEPPPPAPPVGWVATRTLDAYRDLAAGRPLRAAGEARVLDFGRNVQVDRVVLHRAPGAGGRVVLHFGGGPRRAVALRAGAAAEDVVLGSVVKCSSLRLTGGEGVTRVEVWGRDPVPVGADPDAVVADPG